MFFHAPYNFFKNLFEKNNLSIDKAIFSSKMPEKKEANTFCCIFFIVKGHLKVKSFYQRNIFLS